MSILNLIFNIFMIITQWDKVTNYIIILQLRTFGTMVSIVYLMFRAQNVQNVCNDISSYIFKRKLNGFTNFEVLQLETILSCLFLRKPKLTFLNAFIVGTNLLSSISGTIITYVLVALQFYQNS
ncbi:uncharacterized protein LOC109602411 [Aethina tumida]|uniref:uncharacterized protein LOC109602411 n=1 Tax=Aethina tumida TaxID=116153 RepID=UPI002147FB7D|nr:uncharacterized protein LOC109602411 [Aethina tumida]